MDTIPHVYQQLLMRAEDLIGQAAFGPESDEAGLLYEALTDTFEGLAACNLLLEMDVAQFRTDLLYSAAARGQFLAMCASQKAEPLYRASSRTHALFSAIAARDDGLAADLVRLGPGDWIADGEYEDDFCYHAVIALLAAPAEAAATLPSGAEVLDRFERALEGQPSPRLDLCRAFAADDPDAFAVAFDDLLLAHEQWVDEVENARRGQPDFLATRLVFVEGLALLALAGARGWPLPGETALCPGPARLGPITEPVPDLFGEIAKIATASRLRRGLDPLI